MSQSTWQYFLANQQQRSEALATMPEAPPWRQFMPKGDFEKSAKKESDENWETLKELAEQDIRGLERGKSFRLSGLDPKDRNQVLYAVNAAIHLRRPLLVTGKPGSGKTSLAYSIAYELALGPVLSWPVSARSTLEEALYRYDAVARLQDVQLREEASKPAKSNDPKTPQEDIQNNPKLQMGDYIRLGAVGAAFLPSDRPRVLLIDEIDKCDINLPNDLLNLFEEGRYEIPELVRCKEEQKEVTVRSSDPTLSATIREGQVRCYEFPIVIMTSNGERDFPAAFLRRCLRLRMPDPSQNPQALEDIVKAHLSFGKTKAAANEEWKAKKEIVGKLIQNFIELGPVKTDDIATDQLLNLVYLLSREIKPDDKEQEELQKLLLKALSEED